MAPNLIENRIEALFRQYSRKIWERVDEVTKFGVCFLSHFLYIHPFMNRNGRVARLLGPKNIYIAVGYTDASLS